jgi:hypothetical protein
MGACSSSTMTILTVTGNLMVTLLSSRGELKAIDSQLRVTPSRRSGPCPGRASVQNGGRRGTFWADDVDGPPVRRLRPLRTRGTFDVDDRHPRPRANDDDV